MPEDNTAPPVDEAGTTPREPRAAQHVLPNFRTDRLDLARDSDDGIARINLASHFIEWCERHNLLPQRLVDGKLKAIRGRHRTRIIQGNATGFLAGGMVSEGSALPVELGPAVRDSEYSELKGPAMAMVLYTLPDFTRWRVLTFANWCWSRSLVPKVKMKDTSAPEPVKPGIYMKAISHNAEPPSAPGTMVEPGDDVIVVLEVDSRS